MIFIRVMLCERINRITEIPGDDVEKNPETAFYQNIADGCGDSGKKKKLFCHVHRLQRRRECKGKPHLLVTNCDHLDQGVRLYGSLTPKKRVLMLPITIMMGASIPANNIIMYVMAPSKQCALQLCRLAVYMR